MRASTILSIAAGVCVFVLVLAGAPRYGAVADEPASVAVAIPTEPDFYIQDWPLPTALSLSLIHISEPTRQ